MICNCFGCEPVSPGFILPFCRYRPVQADAGLPAWSSLPTELGISMFVSVDCYQIRTEMSVHGGLTRGQEEKENVAPTQYVMLYSL
jgi:hypothetical protein